MKDVISGCSVEVAMNLIGGRWRLLIVSYLLEKPKGLATSVAISPPYLSGCSPWISGR